MSSCAFIGEPFISPCRGVCICVNSTVRRLNRRRQNTKLCYQSKLELAREMLQQVLSYLPKTNPVYVLFDSWYTSAKLVKWIRQQGWHVIAAIKSNRKLSGRKLTPMAPRTQGLRLPACVPATGEQAMADVLCPRHDRPPAWCSRPGAGAVFTKGTRGAHPEVFPEYGHDVVRPGDLETLSAPLEPRGRLLPAVRVRLAGVPRNEE